MTHPDAGPFVRMSTGVFGLDPVLGGGLPEYSFNVISGTPGTGKTTLVHQIAFANASPARQVLYFTVMGESPIKMLRYQQRYTFFDAEKVGGTIRFINLSDMVLERDLGKVLERIVSAVEQGNPGIVVVDSFHAVFRSIGNLSEGEIGLQAFLQRLAMHLAVWHATTFLVGEFGESEAMSHNPVFSVADTIIWLSQTVVRSSAVRKLQVVKVRGQEPMSGLHTFRITQDGIQVFPRMLQRPEGQKRAKPLTRLATGVTGMDDLTGGGIPAGDSVLVAGPAGSGKTTLAAQFIVEGLKHHEPGVIVAFEEHPQEYLCHTRGLGVDLDEMIRQDKLGVIYLRPLDLSVDETLYEITEAVIRLDAKRVVIDSLSGFEIALAPPYREDFRESLYRMVGTLTGLGVTVLMTVEVSESFSDLRFSPHAVSFLCDDIILQRYIELDGQLRKVTTVVKMRGGTHSPDLRFYEIGSDGLVIGEALSNYRGIITGVPVRIENEPA